MTPKTMGIFNTRVLMAAAIAAVVVLGSVCVAEAQTESPQPLSVPAEFVRGMRLPGLGDQIRRPSAVCVDHQYGEVFVTDTMANRIVVFDRDGLYRFEFGCADHVATPQDVAVDSDGFVFVLGTTREGRRLVRFDFDGIFLSYVNLEQIPTREIQSIAIDEKDRLVLLDRDAIVHVITREGTPIHQIDVGTTVAEGQRRELLLGKPIVSRGQLFVPASSVGIVLRFDMETGEYLGSIGRRGNTQGELNFPVAVDVTSDGLVMVLDKMRFTVVCYALDGRFLGEFGGKGYRDGWFYHPSLLIASDDDRVVVGQIMDGRIQVCRIPRFVRTRLMQGRAVRGDDEVGPGNVLGMIAPNALNKAVLEAVE